MLDVANVDDVIITPELAHRAARPRDREAECRAIVTLTRALAEAPGGAMQMLAEDALELCRAQIAGVSLLDEHDGERSFRWQALAGPGAEHLGRLGPHDFGPCAITVDRAAPQLFSRPGRSFPGLGQVQPPIAEALLVPFEVGGRPGGVIWVATQDDRRRFDVEDARLVRNLGHVCAAALQIAAGEAARRSEERLRGAMHDLRTSELRLWTLLQNVRDYAIFMIDPSGYITEWTEGAERVKGYKAEEVIGKHVSIFYPPEAVAAGEVEREIEEAAIEGRVEREAWRVRKGGQRFWGNEIATAIRDHQGKLLGFAKISRDLDERKQMQDALRESEERHRLMIESVRDYAIFMVDASGRVVTWGTGARRVFGYPDEEVVGQSSDIFFTEEDRAAGVPARELATALAEGRASDDRWQLRRGGARFWASGVTTAFRDESGALRGFVKVCRDLTEQKLLEDQREQVLAREQEARQEAEAATRMKDEFIATVSHELRTPLAAILLWAKMLQRGTPDQRTVRQGLEAITRAANSQSQLIEDLLDVSRMISGKLRLHRVETELGVVIAAAVESVRPMADAKGIAIEMSLAPGTGLVSIDPDRMQQVIWNLLTNAVKFTPAGGRATVRLARRGGWVEIQVSDTGQGIPPELLPHVFERFRQADASITREHGGLGLGLAIVNQLVELHGGEVDASSPGAGQGSTFVVRLPAAAQRSKTRPSRLGAAGAGAEPSQEQALALKALRVLLVEDDPDTRNAILFVLEQNGAEVTAVGSAAEAVAAVAQQWPDVLLSDIGMPGEDGYGLIRRLREMEGAAGSPTGGKTERAVGGPAAQPLPAAALTAYARQEDLAKAMAAGFHAHIAKPIDPDRLISAVAELARRRT